MLSVEKVLFENKLKLILTKAAQKAFESTVDSTGDGNTDSEVDASIKKTALKFGQAFAEESAGDLADAIMDFIKSAGINITYVPTTLVSPVGPVTGALTITPMTAQIQIL